MMDRRNDDSLRYASQRVAETLLDKQLTLATAESCTGGWISKVCTDLAGSSGWFAGGVVSYSNRAKADLLGVEKSDLVEQGAVSEAVVLAMAAGARSALRADIAVAVSGVAGPSGGSPEKPVGTVWIACATAEGAIAAQHLFTGDREAVRRATVLAALQMALDTVSS